MKIAAHKFFFLTNAMHDGREYHMAARRAVAEKNIHKIAATRRVANERGTNLVQVF